MRLLSSAYDAVASPRRGGPPSQSSRPPGRGPIRHRGGTTTARDGPFESVPGRTPQPEFGDRASAGSDCASAGVERVDLGGEVLVDEVTLDRLLGREIAIVLAEFDRQDRELLDPLGT